MESSCPDWLKLVREKVESLRYGVVQIVIHDSRVTLIERPRRPALFPPRPKLSTDQTNWRHVNQSELRTGPPANVPEFHASL